ncbi:MAG: hypothetical protein AAF368_07725, partial [Planctomycetota bacterium]
MRGLAENTLGHSARFAPRPLDTRWRPSVAAAARRLGDLEKSEKLDQLRRENLDKDQSNLDEIREENLEKSEK